MLGSARGVGLVYINVVLQNWRAFFQCTGGNYRGTAQSWGPQNGSLVMVGKKGNRTSEGPNGKKIMN